MTKKGWITVLTMIALTLLVVSCGPPQYSDNELMNHNAKTISGTVTQQSRGSFSVTDEKGVEVLFYTGQLTQYIPQLYRSQKDDEVRVFFKELIDETGNVKRSVLQLYSTRVPEQNKAPSEAIEGTIVAFKKGSSRHLASMIFQTDTREDPYLIYIPKSKPVFKLKGKFLNTNEDDTSCKSPGCRDTTFYFDDYVGNTAKASFKHIPILRGNAYVFEAVLVNIKPAEYSY